MRADEAQVLLHICYVPADRAWVHGRLVVELGVTRSTVLVHVAR